MKMRRNVIIEIQINFDPIESKIRRHVNVCCVLIRQPQIITIIFIFQKKKKFLSNIHKIHIQLSLPLRIYLASVSAWKMVLDQVIGHGGYIDPPWFAGGLDAGGYIDGVAE